MSAAAATVGRGSPAERRTHMASDSDMVGPGAQETNAAQAIQRDRVDEAQVYAILALASAVNRLAAAQEAIAAAQA